MVNFLCKICLLTTAIFMASSNANPVEVPETDIAMFNTSADDESHSNFKEPQPKPKIENDFEDLDPMDEEELLNPLQPTRVRRAIVFRPLFVYRQEQERERLIAADRRSGRASEGHHGHGQGQRQKHGEHSRHHQHGY